MTGHLRISPVPSLSIEHIDSISIAKLTHKIKLKNVKERLQNTNEKKLHIFACIFYNLRVRKVGVSQYHLLKNKQGVK